MEVVVAGVLVSLFVLPWIRQKLAEFEALAAKHDDLRAKFMAGGPIYVKLGKDVELEVYVKRIGNRIFPLE